MRTIKTVKGQTLMDLAIQEYGNLEAAFQILEDNPRLAGLNDYPVGQLVDDFCDFDFSHPIKPGVEVFINEDSDLVNQGVLKKLSGKTIISE